MKTYLFDFDGTLVDSMPYFIKGVLKILNEYKINYDNDIIKTITPLGFAGTARHFIKHYGIEKTEEELIEAMKLNMFNDYFYTIQLKNNVEAVLKELKKENASLNILTASPHVTLDACLKRLNIYNIFDNVWSCDDFNTSKNNPEIYKLVAKKLNVNIKDILFLDDNLNANLTAKSAGMLTCGVFDQSSSEYVKEITETTNFYIYDFSELLSIHF